MKIRTIFPIVSSLSVLALPAAAADADNKAELADEPGKTADPPPAPAPAASPAPTPAAKADAAATVNMGGNATDNTKRTSLAASPVTRGGTESSQASKEWKTDFHGYFRVPFRLGIGSRPSPKLPLPIGASQSEKT